MEISVHGLRPGRCEEHGKWKYQCKDCKMRIDLTRPDVIADLTDIADLTALIESDDASPPSRKRARTDEVIEPEAVDEIPPIRSVSNDMLPRGVTLISILNLADFVLPPPCGNSPPTIIGPAQKGRCEHGRPKNKCKHCGTGYCKHGHFHQCKACSLGYCKHRHPKNRCRDCGGWGLLVSPRMRVLEPDWFHHPGYHDMDLDPL